MCDKSPDTPSSDIEDENESTGTVAENNKNALSANTIEEEPPSLPLSISDVHKYDFYQLVELLHQIKDQDLKKENIKSDCHLLFSSNPSLGFPVSDVTALSPVGEDRWCLETTFLGLNGAQSPLPSFFLEKIATEDESGVRALFLDFFNHRLISLLHQIWRKYRYYIRFREEASDSFSAQLFALVGLADERLRGETPVNWCKMLSYAGMLAGRSRSPQMVSGIISHYFDIDDVTIKQWERRVVAISQDQKLQLGMSNSSLGHDTVIGDKSVDCMGKFVICLNGLDQERFKDFLPSGKDHHTFLTLVEFILREQMAFDLELVIKECDTTPMQLNSMNSASLGWLSFLGSASQTRRVRIQVRQ